ncbi:MAG: PLAT/LH2 domain-containing protein [Pirellulales bacterium]
MSVKHRIDIKTGSVQGAGTDENVHVEFAVDGIDLGSLTLPGSGGRFENSRFDAFIFYAPFAFQHATTCSLRIGHETNDNPDWYCEKVAISADWWAVIFEVNDWIRAGQPAKTFHRSNFDLTEVTFKAADTISLFDEQTGKPKLR